MDCRTQTSDSLLKYEKVPAKMETVKIFLSNSAITRKVLVNSSKFIPQHSFY